MADKNKVYIISPSDLTYICYPRIVKSGVKTKQSELFERKVKLRLI